MEILLRYYKVRCMSESPTSCSHAPLPPPVSAGPDLVALYLGGPRVLICILHHPSCLCWDLQPPWADLHSELDG